MFPIVSLSSSRCPIMFFPSYFRVTTSPLTTISRNVNFEEIDNEPSTGKNDRF